MARFSPTKDRFLAPKREAHTASQPRASHSANATWSRINEYTGAIQKPHRAIPNISSLKCARILEFRICAKMGTENAGGE